MACSRFHRGGLPTHSIKYYFLLTCTYKSDSYCQPRLDGSDSLRAFWTSVLKNHRGGEQRKHAGVFAIHIGRQTCRYFHSDRCGEVIYAKSLIYHTPPSCGNCTYHPRRLCRAACRVFVRRPIFKVPKSVFQVRKIDHFSELAKGYLILKSHL